jgi:hypothetical protein
MGDSFRDASFCIIEVAECRKCSLPEADSSVVRRHGMVGPDLKMASFEERL